MAETEPNAPQSSLDALSPGAMLTAKHADTVVYLRVLHCDPERLDSAAAWLNGQPQVVTIDILSPNAWPQITPLIESLQRLANGLWAQYLGQDPFPFPYPNGGFLPKKISTNYLQRRDALARIVHLVTDAKPACFIKCERSRLLAESAHVNHCSQSLVRKWTRRFWQSGEDENSLFLRHRFSGASTIEEVLKNAESLPKRRGRPPKVLSLLPAPTNVSGENDKALPSRMQRELFLKGFDEYLNENKNTGLVSSGTGFPWTDALQFVIKRYFETQTCATFDRRGQPCHDIHRVPEHLLPTLAQFIPVIKRRRSIEAVVKLIEGTRRFNLNYRAKGGAPRRMIIGPGGLYITDWTLADIHLVARLSRLPCGRPNVCTVVDYFSGAMVGIYVTFANPSIETTRQALRFAFSDHVAYAAKFGVPLKAGEWPGSNVVCWRLQGDNGPLASFESDRIVESQLCNVSNTPPYRGDMNGPGENSFRCMNMTIRFLKGHTRGPRERHAPNPALQSQLDIVQFTGLLISWAVNVFDTRVIADYPRTELMAKHPVAATPRDLWAWGCAYIGSPRKMTDDEIRRRLMLVSEATVRDDGIWFLSVCFLSDDPFIRKLVFKAAHYGNFKVRICYDLDDTNSIELLVSTHNESPIRVPIAAVSEQFANLTFQEVCMHIDDCDALDRIRLLEHKTKEREEKERARRLESEAASTIAAKFGDVKGRNQVARLTDPKSERETELSATSKPPAENATMAASPKTPPRSIDIRARFAQDTTHP